MPKPSIDCSIRPKEINPDNDITGIGVTIGYTATAGIVVAIIIVHYFVIHQPDPNPFRKDNDVAELTDKTVHFRPNPVDKMVLGFFRRIARKLSCGGRISSTTHSRLEEAFTKSVLSMSDAQIITGIAIFISGLAQLRYGLSCFEWQILTNLAWFSSLTHLSCLTVLRSYLYQRPVERAWRLLSMFVLVTMLSLALLPATNYHWGERNWNYGHPKLAPGPKLTDYAICYLKPDRRYQTQSSVLSSAISIVLISLGFILRVIRLHQPFSSFIWWLIVSFVWGTLKLIVSRYYYFPGNDKWTFGQVTAVLLLAIPLVTIFEYFSPDPKDGQTKDLGSVAITTREQQSSPFSQPYSRLGPAFSTLSLPTRAVDDPDSDSFYDSGLLTMPILWTLISIFAASLQSAVGVSSLGLLAFLTSNPALNFKTFWAYVFLICSFFTLVMSVLFSFLISTTGSHERTQHPSRRRIFQIGLAVVPLGTFYGMFTMGLIYYVYLALLGLAVVYILCCLFFGGLAKYRSH